MARRPLPNHAMEAIEQTYAHLLKLERELAAGINNPNISMGAFRIRVQSARLAASRGREALMECHPRVKSKSIKYM